MPKNQPLSVDVKDGELVIRIGIDVLAHAVTYSSWANPYDVKRRDHFRTFAIADAEQFAKDVQRAILHEYEDGSTPLSDFLDTSSEMAVDEGSEGCCEDDNHLIKFGDTAYCEKSWAVDGGRVSPSESAVPSNPETSSKEPA